MIGITQSGETADTLAAMRLAREAGAPVLALTNIMGSQATREADAVLFTRAGLEIGVAATKTHVAQIAALLLLTLHLARVRGTLSDDELQQARARAAPRCPPWSRTACSANPPGRGDRAALLRRALLLVPRPRHRLRRVPRGRPQAQGDRLHPDRGLRRRRDEARAHRPARQRLAGGRRGQRQPGLRQGRHQHRGGAGPRRRRDRGGHRRQRGDRARSPPPCCACRAATRWWPPWWPSCRCSCWPTTSPACAA